MRDFSYKRVDLTKLGDTPGQGTGVASTSGIGSPIDGVRVWVIPLSILLCCIQATLTVVAESNYRINPTSTLIAVISFGVLFALVFLVNPLLSFLGRGVFRRFNRIELICIFASLLVTSGLSTFGLAAHLVPLVPAPWNAEWNTSQRGWDRNITNPDEPLLNPKLYLQDETAIRLFREGVPTIPPPEGAGLGSTLQYYGEVFSQIPWGQWFGPIALWMVFLLGCLAVFYSLAFVVLHYWSSREKLIFPLAQLPEAILPEDSDKSRLPAIFYNPVFWIGFALSALVLSWNAASSAGWVTEDYRIALGLSVRDFRIMVMGTFLEGITGGHNSIRFLILFTAIGIAFLIPAQISFSTWFYFLVSQIMILIAVWMGFGQNFGDFPSNFRSASNFLTAQGGGALMMFSAISLFRCLREYYQLSLGKSSAERFRLLSPVIWLFGSITVVVLWLLWNQISIFWALTFVLFFTLLTVGLMRIVAETGIYWFQANTGFFHFFSAFGLGKLIPGAMIAPLMPLYSIFFMDIKAFSAPNMLNAAKMQADCGKGRRMFHLNMILCIVISTLLAIALLIFFSHQRGGQQMSEWFFNQMPVLTLNDAQSLVSDTAEGFSANGVWILVGAAWLCFSLWIRHNVFWFPHPIGYILLFNPLTTCLWFGFFIGWIIKKAAVRYGGKSTFDRLKPLFIGLIFGELIAIFCWMLLGLLLDFQSGIDLNRTNP